MLPSDSTYFNLLALLQLIEDILDSIGTEDRVAGDVELDKIDHDAEAWSGQNEELTKVLDGLYDCVRSEVREWPKTGRSRHEQSAGPAGRLEELAPTRRGAREKRGDGGKLVQPATMAYEGKESGVLRIASRVLKIDFGDDEKRVALNVGD